MSGSIFGKPALEKRKKKLLAGGWPISKWISFCETMQARGFLTRVYESRSTRSKYVYVIRGERAFKVRFSNHRPNAEREIEGDCDFFVGVNHHSISTTADAIRAVEEFFAV